MECVRRVLDSTAIASDRGMSALHLAVQVSDPTCRQDYMSPGRSHTSLPPVMLFGSLKMVSDCCQQHCCCGPPLETQRWVGAPSISSHRFDSQPAKKLQGKMAALVAQLLTLPAAVATVNLGDKDGLTPLHWAATEGISFAAGHALWIERCVAVYLQNA